MSNAAFDLAPVYRKGEVTGPILTRDEMERLTPSERILFRAGPNVLLTPEQIEAMDAPLQSELAVDDIRRAALVICAVAAAACWTVVWNFGSDGVMSWEWIVVAAALGFKVAVIDIYGTLRTPAQYRIPARSRA